MLLQTCRSNCASRARSARLGHIISRHGHRHGCRSIQGAKYLARATPGAHVFRMPLTQNPDSGQERFFVINGNEGLLVYARVPFLKVRRKFETGYPLF